MIHRLAVISCLFLASFARILYLKPGRISGFDYKTKEGVYAEVFLNIPYASAPVGELRFEKPTPPKPWEGIRDCTKFGSSCYPIRPTEVVPPEQPSEDCLTLNLIRPKKEAPLHGFPIMFWVHGGSYESGSAVRYGYKGLADIYIPHDIIVVTTQYRLGVYGFFSTGDSRMPGNLGLFDMAEALKFIHTNARTFGGDPSRITVCGHSAGSAAAGQLILSPVTRDYISRSIEMSGSAWGIYARGAAVANYSLELAEVLGCSAKIKECMKQKSVEEIYQGIEEVELVQSVYSGNHLEEILKEIIGYYIDRGEQKEFEFYINRYTEENDVFFVVPTVVGILARRDAGWKIYAYSLDHYNDATWSKDVPKKLRGPFHESEFPYTIGKHIVRNIPEGEANEEEQRIAEIFRQSFINFVKIGAPSNNHKVWLDVGTDARIRYLQITPNPQIKQGFYNESTAFWRKIRQYGFDIM
ncbi:hypothetical protein Aduo_016802 [Ancylostoma duodenale]